MFFSFVFIISYCDQKDKVWKEAGHTKEKKDSDRILQKYNTPI